MKTAKLIWRVRVLKDVRDGEEHWQTGTERMTYSQALAVGGAHVRAGRRAQLVDEDDAGADMRQGDLFARRATVDG
jgi:hypothetical protein